MEHESDKKSPLPDPPAVEHPREGPSPAPSFLRRRLSTDEYLGLHLTVGMLVSLAMLGLFAVIARSATSGSGPTTIDLRIGLALRDHRLEHPAIKYLFWVITQMGSLYTLAILAVLVTLLLFNRRQRLLSLVWFVTLAGAGLLDAGMKRAFDRPRPEFRDPLVHEDTTSFPSGHSMGSVVGYGFLAYLLQRVLPRRKGRWVILGAVVLILLIGFSRMYLGAHYFTDVMGGYAVGSCWLAAVISGLEVVRNRRQQRRAAETPPAERGRG